MFEQDFVDTNGMMEVVKPNGPWYIGPPLRMVMGRPNSSQVYTKICRKYALESNQGFKYALKGVQDEKRYEANCKEDSNGSCCKEV